MYQHHSTPAYPKAVAGHKNVHHVIYPKYTIDRYIAYKKASNQHRYVDNHAKQDINLRVNSSQGNYGNAKALRHRKGN